MEPRCRNPSSDAAVAFNGGVSGTSSCSHTLTFHSGRSMLDTPRQSTMERQSGVGVQMPYQPNVRETNSNTRLSDAHRDAAVDLLTSHVASGRLTIEDFDGRAAQA